MKNSNTLLLSIAALALVGCVGSPDDPDATSSGLVEVPVGVEPLHDLGMSWRTAPAGCEDKLAAGVSFAIASAHDGLIAAVDSEGDIVCVDTVESVQAELEESGRGDEAEVLGDRFRLSVGLSIVPDPDSIRAGDPSPQPSVIAHAPGDEGIDNGDPSPQPSSQPRR